MNACSISGALPERRAGSREVGGIGGSTVIAVARRSGRELWQKETLLNRDITGPTGYGSSVVVGDFDGYVHWFDAATGEVQARVRAGSDRVSAPPLVVNEMLFILTDGGKLYAFKDVTPEQKS